MKKKKDFFLHKPHGKKYPDIYQIRAQELVKERKKKVLSNFFNLMI